MKALLRWIFSDAFPSSSSFPKDSALILPTPGIDSSVYMTFHDDPSGLPLNGNNIIETRVGPSVISIFEFLLRAHHSQAESTLQALFHRFTLLSPGNHSLLFIKTKYCTFRTCPPPLFISLLSDPKTQISQKTSSLQDFRSPLYHDDHLLSTALLHLHHRVRTGACNTKLKISYVLIRTHFSYFLRIFLHFESSDLSTIHLPPKW